MMIDGAGVIERDVLRVSGPDAVSFLQGQLSQDIAALGVGASAWSLLLSPKGRVDAWMRVTRIADGAVLIDTDAGGGEAIATRLNRFKLRTDCEIENLPWSATAVRGATAEALRTEMAGGGEEVVIAGLEWPGETGYDVLHAEPLNLGDAPSLSPSDLDAARIDVARPRVGAEISDDSIPAEFGDDFVQRSVSFTKGCYVGQELVARMASRGGSAPRKLVRVSGSGPSPELLAAIRWEGDDKGTITSVASGPDSWRGLAVVHRTVPTPGAAQSDAGEVQLSEIEGA